MIIIHDIHDMNTQTLPRHVQNTLAERLRVVPAVVITGARQTGKSTLVQLLTPSSPRVKIRCRHTKSDEACAGGKLA